MVCNGVVSYENRKTGLTAEEIPPSAFGISPKGGAMARRAEQCHAMAKVL